MNRIQQIFQQGKAFVGYLTAGDGGMQQTLDAALALIAGGVNILELGVPFSDPIADGPVIQRAATRALANGTTLQQVLQVARDIRKHSEIPLVLFSYYNPILVRLKSDFLTEAKQAGIDGLLIVDCPFEEASALQIECQVNGIDLIYVITPSTPTARIQLISQQATGFLYYACRKGTTGMKDTLPDDFIEKITLIKQSTHLPVVVGFGISNREMAQEIITHADGFVVGSRFVKALEDGILPKNLMTLAAELNPKEINHGN